MGNIAQNGFNRGYSGRHGSKLGRGLAQGPRNLPLLNLPTFFAYSLTHAQEGPTFAGFLVSALTFLREDLRLGSIFLYETEAGKGPKRHPVSMHAFALRLTEGECTTGSAVQAPLEL